MKLTKPVREHSCTTHSMGDRWGREKCLACAYEAGAEAQLEDCEKEAQEKVKEIFKEIEDHDFTYDFRTPDGKQYIAPWWQALKQKYQED